MGMVLEPNSLNPAFRGTIEEGLVNSLMVRSLAHFDSNSELVPHVAISAPQFKKNKLEFEIRADAKWDDETPVTCADFQTGLFSQKKFRSSSKGKVDKIEIAIDNLRKCIVHFNIRKPIYTLYMPPPLPTHIEKSKIEASENEIEYLKKTQYSLDPTFKGLANGPYKISVYKPGYYIELERNSVFYGQRPFYDKLQIRFYSSLQGIINAFSSQEIDMILNGLTSERAEEIQKIITEKKLKSKIVSRASTKLIHLEFNMKRKYISDLRIRQAMSLLIDPKELAKIVGGDGELTGSLAHFTDPNFMTEYSQPRYKLDFKKAVQLIKDSGYLKNPVELVLTYNSENLDRERVAVYLHNKWTAAGLKVFLKKQLKRVLIGETVKKGDFDVAVFSWSQPKLQINRSFFDPKNIPSVANQWQGSNYARWENKTADEAMRKADEEYDVQKIKTQLKKFYIEFNKDLPWLPLYFENRITVVPDSFTNYTVFPDWESETYEVEAWR